MYGWIHICIRNLVTEKFGQEIWEKVLKEGSVDDSKAFVTFQHYEDAVTFQIVGAVCSVLELPIETVLEVFGDYFVGYVIRLGYGDMLQTLGSDLKSFLQNLDFLHFVYLKMTFVEMNAPSFRCEDEGNGQLRLNYYSSRSNLAPIVIGVIKAVAEIFFKLKVKVEVLTKNDNVKFGERNLVSLSIKYLSDEINNENTKVYKENLKKTSRNASPLTISKAPLISKSSLISATISKKNDASCVPDQRVMIDMSTFCKVFPFHVVFNQQLIIKQVGCTIQKMCRNLNLSEGGVKYFSTYFEIQHPVVPLRANDIRQFTNMLFLVKMKPKAMESPWNEKAALTLRGQMVWMEKNQSFAFLCSPLLTNLQDMKNHELYFSDIAIHDVTRDLLLFNQQRRAEMEISKRLEEKKEELRCALKDLAEEKEKTELLLYSMLPKQVADKLREGIQVEAGHFKVVTILFSDIVTFTTICSQCKPMQVVHLLNELYSKFDRLTEVHGVYKVETIGDAYMICGGIPIQVPTHAERVANFGLAMIATASTINSPISEEPIQIRVGIHTGPVVAGCVGLKMPRYCLFGDTVNVSSRMESSGIALKVHISQNTYRELVKKKIFDIEERGLTEIKGKGKMPTYFINNNKKASIDEIMGKGEISQNEQTHYKTEWNYKQGKFEKSLVKVMNYSDTKTSDEGI